MKMSKEKFLQEFWESMEVMGFIITHEIKELHDAEPCPCGGSCPGCKGWVPAFKHDKQQAKEAGKCA